MSKTKSRFSNRIYRAEVSHTEVGSPIVEIIPINPKGPSASHRQVSAFLYDLASEMEKRSEEIGARWVISPESWGARLILELGNDQERTKADAFVARLLADRNLA